MTCGGSLETRRSASPVTYLSPGAPPFLIIQGTDDPLTRPRQSVRFSEALVAAGNQATLIEVAGAGHGLSTANEHPAADELAATVVDFFSENLR